MKKREYRAFQTWLGRNREKYGMHSHRYPQKAANLSYWVSQKISHAVRSGGSLENLFLELLKSVGEQRNLIARILGSQNCDQFGILRSEGEDFRGLLTPLRQEYTTASEIIVSRLNKQPSGIIFDEFSKVSVIKMSREEAIDHGYFTRKGEGIKKHLESMGWTNFPLKEVAKQLSPSIEVRKIEALAYPDVYRHNLLNGQFRYYEKHTSPIQWEGYTLAEVELRIHENWVHGAHMLIGHKKGKSGFVLLRHADPTTQAIYQEYLSSLFARTVRANDTDFFSSLAYFEYVFAFATPYVRGSASIREIIARAMMHYKEIEQIPYKKGVSIDLVAFQNLLYTSFSPEYFLSYQRGYQR